MRLTRLLAVSAFLGAFAAAAACGSTSADAPIVAGGDASLDAPLDVDADASFPILPYPAGPYGIGVGEVMPDLVLQGYRMSRAQRDSTKLPFENIRLSEVRSDPSCACMMLVFNPSGTACPPCVEMALTVSSLVSRDPTLCAAELVPFSYDALDPDAGSPLATPPTRADLDFHTQLAREPYPVGLPTTSVNRQPFTAINAFPDIFVMRPGDMKVAAFLQGTGDVETRIRKACASPEPGPKDIASGLSVKHLAVDDANVYFTDVARGVARAPKDGGPVTVLAAPPSIPEAFVVAGAYVYWARSGAISTVERVAITGGATEIVTSGATAYGSIAVEGSDLWFTKGDVIGHVPITGGAEVTFATDVAPKGVVADASDVYWVSATDVVAAPRAGGARRVVLGAVDYVPKIVGTPSPRSLLMTDGVVAVQILAERAGAVAMLPKGGGAPLVFTAFPRPTAFSVSATGRIMTAITDPELGSVIMWVNPDAGTVGADTWHITSREIPAVADDGTFAYWAEGDRIRKVGRP